MKKNVKNMLEKQIKLMSQTWKDIIDVRRDCDSSRNRISSAINILMNTDWGVQSESMKRGEIMGHLKSAETMLNMSVNGIVNMEVPYNNEIYWLRSHLDIMGIKERKKDKNNKDKKNKLKE